MCTRTLFNIWARIGDPTVCAKQSEQPLLRRPRCQVKLSRRRETKQIVEKLSSRGTSTLFNTPHTDASQTQCEYYTATGVKPNFYCDFVRFELDTSGKYVYRFHLKILLKQQICLHMEQLFKLLRNLSLLFGKSYLHSNIIYKAVY